MIAQNRYPKSQGYLLRGRYYKPGPLYEWVQRNPTVPHNRSRLTPAEVRNIARAAGRTGNTPPPPDQRDNDWVEPEPEPEPEPPSPSSGSAYSPTDVSGSVSAPPPRSPRRVTRGNPGAADALQPIYLRRPARGQQPFRYFRVHTPTRAYEWRQQGWHLLLADRFDQVALTSRPGPVDVSMDFNAGAGHWERVRTAERDTWHQGETNNRVHSRNAFFQALRQQLPNALAHVWQPFA